MDNIFNAIDTLANSIKQNAHLTLGIIATLWAVHIVNVLFKHRLNIFGIYPRTWHGLIGIICAPFLHGNVQHLIFNSIPLFLLMNMVLVNGVPIFYAVTLIIVLLSGFAVWLFGRKALHIGASGVVMGYWGYVLINAIEQRTAVTILVAVVGVYYFGGMLLNLLPGDAKSSWESHIFGFLAGGAAYFILSLHI